MPAEEPEPGLRPGPEPEARAEPETAAESERRQGPQPARDDEAARQLRGALEADIRGMKSDVSDARAELKGEIVDIGKDLREMKASLSQLLHRIAPALRVLFLPRARCHLCRCLSLSPSASQVYP